MVSRFRQFITEHRLFDNGDNILVAVSGGIDSVVLCHLLFSCNFRFSIIHCNFKLRGEESEQDEIFVQKLAQFYKTPFFQEDFDVRNFTQTHKVSIQTAARQLRYGWFEHLARENSALILTGHHLSDQSETILFNLIRGTGIAGLHGIFPQKGYLIRPLLFATREEIADYANQNNLTWREDSSNESDKYRRNFIRHRVIPLLKELNPAFDETMNHTAGKMRAIEEIAHQTIAQKARKTVRKTDQDFRIHIDQLQTLSNPEMFLFHWIAPFGFSLTQAKAIIRSIKGQSGKLFESENYFLIKDRRDLIVDRKSKFTPPLSIPANTSEIRIDGTDYFFRHIPINEHTISSEKHIAALDRSKLVFPLLLRSWEAGDAFVPLGMKKRKKVSDFLIDEKIPLTVKKKVKVLLSKGEIIWVVGFRISNRFKIRPQTQFVFEIKTTGNLFVK